MTTEDDTGNEDGGKNAKLDYEVGYGKPPKHSQFQKGRSGNPGGPKTGSRGLKKDLHKALNAKHSIRVNGKVITGPAQELAMYSLAARAAAGDVRAISELTELVMRIFGPDDRGRERHVLSLQDQELLDRALERHEIREDDQGEAENPTLPEAGPEASITGCGK